MSLDAFEFICKYKPEIVITDIRMPGLDGLEIIKKVKECVLDSKFIIISGYRHFEYAHNVLKYNVEDYLLKPIKKLEKVLGKSKVILDLLPGAEHADEAFGTPDNVKRYWIFLINI